jgi:hypothetical protein
VNTIERIAAVIQDLSDGFDNAVMEDMWYAQSKEVARRLPGIAADLRAISVGREALPDLAADYSAAIHDAFTLGRQAPVKVDVEGLARALYEAVWNMPDRVPFEKVQGKEIFERLAQAAYNYTRPVLSEAEWGVVVEALERAEDWERGGERKYNAKGDELRAVATKIKARGK